MPCRPAFMQHQHSMVLSTQHWRGLRARCSPFWRRQGSTSPQVPAPAPHSSAALPNMAQVRLLCTACRRSVLSSLHGKGHPSCFVASQPWSCVVQVRCGRPPRALVCQASASPSRCCTSWSGVGWPRRIRCCGARAATGPRLCGGLGTGSASEGGRGWSSAHVASSSSEAAKASAKSGATALQPAACRDNTALLLLRCLHTSGLPRLRCLF